MSDGWMMFLAGLLVGFVIGVFATKIGLGFV